MKRVAAILIAVGCICVIGGVCVFYEDRNQSDELAAEAAQIDQLNDTVRVQSVTLQHQLDEDALSCDEPPGDQDH